MAGRKDKKNGLLLLKMTKVSPWLDSLGGPLLIAVAQLLEVCGPASSFTVWSGPLVKLGASFTEPTVMVKLCAGLVSTPPLAVPPSSCNCTVTVATPLEL